MRTVFVKALWGMDMNQPAEALFERIVAAGYEGVEAGLPQVDPAEWRTLCEAHGLAYIAQIYPITPEEFDAQYGRAQEYGPVFVNCHGGRDKMDFETGLAFFEHALAAARRGGTPVVHETHRGRILFTPFVAARYIEALPDLRLCADFSHWCCVCESLLHDMEDWLDLALGRAHYVHTRVGHEQGPQAPDPRAPEYAPHLARHMEWWDRLREARAAEGADTFYVCPEFGPPAYMPTLPYTRQPVADLWDVCLWMARHLESHWKAGSAMATAAAEE